MTASEEDRIKVFARLRPLSNAERGGGAVWCCDGSQVVWVDPASGAPVADPYQLDGVFDQGEDTAAVYEQTTKGLVKHVIDGYNATVFAYGQTASGKTHTMRGQVHTLPGSTEEEQGIIPLAVHDLMGQVAKLSSEREFVVRVSYLELYNEDFFDLQNKNQKLQIREPKPGQVVLQGLHEEIVKSANEVMEALERGDRNRRVGETKMNNRSSRSHALFRIVVESKPWGVAKGPVRVSTFTLVDLAGSERISKTGSEGQRLKELCGAAINKSLSHLGTVINNLSEGVQEAGGHIPYRDSKLTRILQPSLGGNAKTVIICTATAAAAHAEETKNTLQFACRAKKVKSRATVNEVEDNSALLHRYQAEIAELRARLAAEGGSQSGEVEEQVAQLRAQLLLVEEENGMLANQLAEKEAALREKEEAAEEAAEQHSTTLSSIYALLKRSQHNERKLAAAAAKEMESLLEEVRELRIHNAALQHDKAELQAQLLAKDLEIAELRERSAKVLATQKEARRLRGPSQLELAKAVKADERKRQRQRQQRAQQQAEEAEEEEEEEASASGSDDEQLRPLAKRLAARGATKKQEQQKAAQQAKALKENVHL